MADRYRCERCGEIFDEDDLDYEEWYEWHPYGEGRVPERWTEPTCPFCGSELIEEYYGDEEDKEEDERDT